MAAGRAQPPEMGVEAAGAASHDVDPVPPEQAPGPAGASVAETAPGQTVEQRIWQRFLHKLAATHPEHPWTRVWLADAGRPAAPSDAPCDEDRDGAAPERHHAGGR